VGVRYQESRHDWHSMRRRSPAGIPRRSSDAQVGHTMSTRLAPPSGPFDLVTRQPARRLRRTSHEPSVPDAIIQCMQTSDDGDDGLWEDPWALRGRLKLGREEFCQRLLTTLIVGGRYPLWNTESAPTNDGVRFLLGLQELVGTDADLRNCAFVDEYELAARTMARRAVRRTGLSAGRDICGSSS
jgi:hypothetical protein